MVAKIRLSQRALLKLWAIAALGTIVLLVILQLMDNALTTATTASILHLDKADTAPMVRFILDRWQNPMDASLVGAILGLSFLIIPFYGVTLYIGTVTARDALARNAGRFRRYMNALTMVPILAGICDILARATQIQMLVQGPDVLSATATYELTILKWAGITLALLVSIIGGIAALLRRKKKQPEA